MSKIRRQYVKAQDHRGLIAEVTIRVTDTNNRLTKDELERLTAKLTDDSMTSLVNAPFLMCPLYKIKVTR